MSYTLTELKNICKERKIKGYSAKKKKDLLELLGLNDPLFSSENDSSESISNLTSLFSKNTLNSNEKSKPSESIKPFLKWVGGKTQILEEVLSKFPKEINNYHEIFLGGGSVLLGLLSYQKNNKIKINNKIYASDINLNLISLYKNLQNKSEDFILESKIQKERYESFDLEDDKEKFYYKSREEFNSLEDKTSLRSSVLFLFLNKTCFRGVYREGPKGFNVPFGHNKNVGIFEETHLRAISEIIQPIIFTHQSFEKSFENCEKNDFVYLDPPYAPENEKSFVGYVKDGFTLEQHKLLFSKIKLREIKFLMSNSDVELVKNAFQEPYKTSIIECRRAINSKNPGAKTNEVLILNF